MSIWGMKMKDAITPDYESLRMIAYPNYSTVTYKGGPVWDENSYEVSGYYQEDGNVDYEGSLNEGPQMCTRVGEDGVKRYYLTYSQYGFAARDYGVHQAISTSPLGTYTKVTREKSAMIVTLTNDFMTGAGHHALVEADGEMYCLYWVHADPNDATTAANNGRICAVDRLSWVYDETLGCDILYGNGPTKSLQYKPIVAVDGYKNIASEAKVKATNAASKSSVKYLNDGQFVAADYYADREYRAKKKTAITLTFDEPREIRSIMVYNSFDYEYAFAKVDSIEFTLSEKPSWYTLAEYNGKMYIENLGFNADYYNATEKFMRPGGASLAAFNPIKVKSVTVTVSEKLNGKGGEIRISDIAILGK